MSEMSLHRPWMLYTRPSPRRTFRVSTEVAVVVVTLVSMVLSHPYCLQEYRSNPSHTGCLDVTEMVAVPTLAAQIFLNDVILQLVNSFRSSVAIGNVYRFPRAANMLKVEWDYELSALAYMHSVYLVSRSDWPLHDKMENRFTRRFKDTGQSVTLKYNVSHRFASHWNTVIREWFAEHTTMRAATVGYYKYDRSASNITQMWWATTRYVGCAFSTMLTPDGRQYDHSYVCNYAPAGNVDGRPVYIQGSTCSRCPTQMACEPTSGLCVTTHELPPPDFSEGELAKALPAGATGVRAPVARLFVVIAALRVI